MITAPIWRDGDDLVVTTPADELTRLGLAAGDLILLELAWLEPAPGHERSGSSSPLLKQVLRRTGTGAVAACLPDSPGLPQFRAGDTLTFALSAIGADGRLRLAPEDEAAIATFADAPGFRRALAYLRDR